MEVPANKVKEHEEIKGQMERYKGRIEVVKNRPMTEKEKSAMKRRVLGTDGGRATRRRPTI